MTEITEFELRDQIAAVLRAAEAGEEFVITVGGRPAATLGPYHHRRFVPAERVRALLKTPTDPSLLRDVRERTEDRVTDR